MSFKSSNIVRQEKATVVPTFPINGTYPHLRGTIYTEGGYNGFTEDHFVADEGQLDHEYAGIITEFQKVKK